MYRNQGVYRQGNVPNYIRKPGHPLRRLRPAEPPIHWGAYEILSSFLFIALGLVFVIGIAALVLHVAGFHSLTQIYGFDLMPSF